MLPVEEAMAMRARDSRYTSPGAMYCGGAVWRAPFGRPVVLALGNRKMVLVALFDNGGGMCKHRDDGLWEFTPDELKEWFSRDKWEFQGFFHELYEFPPIGAKMPPVEASKST